MTPPKFDYPAPGSRHVYVPCAKDDEQREEYYCPQCDSWDERPQTTCLHHKCGEHWRKRVAVPDGWEILPPTEMATTDHRVIYRSGADEKVMGMAGMSWNEWQTSDLRQGVMPICFIRRQPAAPESGQWVKCSERLPEKEGRYVVWIPPQSGHEMVCSTFRNGCFTSSPQPSYWMHVPPAPEPTAAEKAWAEYRPQPPVTVKEAFLAGHHAGSKGM